MSATGRGAERVDRDKYETPTWVTEVLCDVLQVGSKPKVLEPAVGGGMVADVLEQRINAKVTGIDIEQGIDFLHVPFTTHYDFIITNPPFSLAQQFIEHSLPLADCVIMLLPLGFFGSAERHNFWQAHKPTAIHTLSRRPEFGKNKDGKWGTDSETYAWLVWDKTGYQQTGFNWLIPSDELYKQSKKSFRERYERLERNEARRIANGRA